GVFDANERVGYSNGTVAGSNEVGVLGDSATFAINLSCNAPLGPHRLRVRAMFSTNGISVTPCGANSYGETEDYIITITEPVACPQPYGLTATGTSSTGGNLSWTAGCSETSWELAIQPAGAGAPTSGIVVTGPPEYTASGLAEGTYEYWVRANCEGDGYSGWAGPYVFTKPACSTAVFPANNSNSTLLDSEGLVNLQWTASPGAIEYDVYIGTSSGNLS